MAFLTEAANRGSISTGYEIDNSIKVENDNREYLRWTNFSNQGSSARKKKFTFSVWLKRTELGRQMIFIGTSQNGYFSFDAGDTLTWIQQYGGSQLVIRTNRVFRDTSAWYHLMVVVDTAQSTEANRTKIYVNGVQETSFSTATYPSQNAEASNLYEQHLILGEWGGGSTGLSGYIAEYYFLSEIAAAPTDLGEFDDDTGIWKPKAYDGTISSPSHFLEFKDGSDLGTATSGLDSDYQNNLTAVDQATDTPTNNFATLNPLHAYSGTASGNPTFVEGATRFTTVNSGYWHTAVANIGITSGKWYFEVQPGTSNSHITGVGYGDESDIHDWGQNIADTHGFLGETSTNSIGYLGSDTETTYGNVWLGTGSKSGAANSANYTISNIVGVAIDADNGYIYFAKDNTYINSGNPGSGASGTGGDTFEDTTTPRTGTVFAGVSGYHHTAAAVMNVNFGGYTTISISSAASDANGYGTFEYAPPAGYYALCTKNLAEYGG